MDFSGTAGAVGLLASVVLAGGNAARFDSQNLSTTKYASAKAIAPLISHNAGL
jgi:hypothetical protein